MVSPAKRILVVAASMSLLPALAGCGGDDNGGDASSGDANEVTNITMAQWDAVTLNQTQDDILAQFGDPVEEREQEVGNMLTILYNLSPGGDQYVTFTFDTDTDKVITKVRAMLSGTDVEVSDAEWQEVQKGTTQQQVEKLLGPPFLQRDQVSSLMGAERAVVAAGALQRCLDYRGVTGTVCFDSGGIANYVHPPD